jgi:hypothetical protein
MPVGAQANAMGRSTTAIPSGMLVGRTWAIDLEAIVTCGDILRAPRSTANRDGIATVLDSGWSKRFGCRTQTKLSPKSPTKGFARESIDCRR